jgi:arabinogalactan oligomer/maltooligosaccharide transport system substrate-binding protein
VPTPTPVPPTPTPAPKAVKISIWHGWAGDYFKAIEAAFKDYEKANPGVTIELSKPDNLNDALKVAVPAKKGPDILAWVNDQIGTNALAGNIVDLSKYGVDKAFLQATYEPAAVAGMIWKDKIWGLPETQEGIALVYNKDLMTDEFLPKDPKNFDDLLAKAKAFAEKNPGKFLVCNQGLGNPDAYHVAPIYFGFGMPAYVDDAGKVYFNTPEALKAAKWIVEFSKYAPKETSHDICKTMLIEKKAAAWWTGPWAIADIEKAGIKYGIAPMGRPFVGIKTMMLTSNAVDRGTAEEAVKVMKYFTSAEVQKKLALINKTIPAATKALKDPEVQALPAIAGFGASLNLGVPMASTPYAGAQWGPVGDGTTALWTGKQTPEAAMKAIQDAIEAKVKEMK